MKKYLNNLVSIFIMVIIALSSQGIKSTEKNDYSYGGFSLNESKSSVLNKINKSSNYKILNQEDNLFLIDTPSSLITLNIENGRIIYFKTQSPARLDEKNPNKSFREYLNSAEPYMGSPIGMFIFIAIYKNKKEQLFSISLKRDKETGKYYYEHESCIEGKYPILPSYLSKIQDSNNSDGQCLQNGSYSWCSINDVKKLISVTDP